MNSYLADKKHDERILEGNFNTQWPKLKRQIDKTIESVGEISEEVADVEPSIEEQLTGEARQLLTSAAQRDGRIYYVRYMGGSDMQAGGKDFLNPYTPRNEAIWKGALYELVNNGLAEDLGYEGELFSLSRSGFDVADRILSRAG